MKTLIISAMLLASQMVFAAQGPLDGRTYCRTIISDGGFGQPKGQIKHCLSFSKGIVRDTANTFFGNPPESAKYTVRGNKVTFGTSVYNLSTDQTALATVSGSTVPGTVFTLQK